MNCQEILDAFYFRHACKQFDPNKKIPDDEFDTILQAARLSPSSFGLEPWKFLVIQNKKLRKLLHDNIAGSRTDSGQIPSCSHFVLTLARKDIRYDSDYVQNLMNNVHKFPTDIVNLRIGMVENHQKTSFDLLKNERHLTDWATHQTYIALGNMMTVAAMLGIDSCPIEGFDKLTLNQIIGDNLNVDLDKFSVAYGLTFGYRLAPARAKTRNQMQDVVQWFKA